MKTLKMQELKAIAKDLGIEFNPIGLTKVELIEKIEAKQAVPSEENDYNGMDEVEFILSLDNTKSEKIRALLELGYARAEIAGYVGVRYQMVNNVMKRMLG